VSCSIARDLGPGARMSVRPLRAPRHRCSSDESRSHPLEANSASNTLKSSTSRAKATSTSSVGDPETGEQYHVSAGGLSCGGFALEPCLQWQLASSKFHPRTSIIGGFRPSFPAEASMGRRFRHGLGLAFLLALSTGVAHAQPFIFYRGILNAASSLTAGKVYKQTCLARNVLGHT